MVNENLNGINHSYDGWTNIPNVYLVENSTSDGQLIDKVSLKYYNQLPMRHQYATIPNIYGSIKLGGGRWKITKLPESSD